jgi:hypothetical protein
VILLTIVYFVSYNEEAQYKVYRIKNYFEELLGYGNDANIDFTEDSKKLG